MIAQLGHGWKVEKSAEKMTSFAGLPLLTELAHRSKLIRDLDVIAGVWARQGKYRTSDYVMSLALTLIAGGESLEDTRLLREDGGCKAGCGRIFPRPTAWAISSGARGIARSAEWAASTRGKFGACWPDSGADM
jgi:hypothetical protein